MVYLGMAKEVKPDTTEEDIILMEKILALGDIQHKYAVRLQTVVNSIMSPLVKTEKDQK